MAIAVHQRPLEQTRSSGKYDGHKFFWKIDYFDAAMEFGSDDPADASKTTRVLTIMAPA